MCSPTQLSPTWAWPFQGSSCPIPPPSPSRWLSFLFQDTWLYHLTVAAGGSSAKVGTAYEQLIGKLMDDEGDPGKASTAISAWAVGRWLGNCWSGTQRKHCWTPDAVLKSSEPQEGIPIPSSKPLSPMKGVRRPLRLPSALGQCFTLSPAALLAGRGLGNLQ